MRITRQDHLLQLSFMPRIFPVNCYLVEEEESLTLIDAALPYSVKGVSKTVSQLGKPLTNIVLTHAHGDHVGALDGLKEMYPEVKLSISVRDAKLLRGDTSLESGEPPFKIRGSVPKRIKTVPDVLLAEGDRIGSLQVVSTPGHTPGSISLLDTRSGALIAGDAFQARGGIAVSGTLVPLFPFPAMATWHKESALASARKVASLKPALLAVGHGRMAVHPAQLIARAITEAERSLSRSSRSATKEQM